MRDSQRAGIWVYSASRRYFVKFQSPSWEWVWPRLGFSVARATRPTRWPPRIWHRRSRWWFETAATAREMVVSQGEAKVSGRKTSTTTSEKGGRALFWWESLAPPCTARRPPAAPRRWQGPGGYVEGASRTLFGRRPASFNVPPSPNDFWPGQCSWCG